MRPSRRDVLITIAAALALAIVVANLRGWAWPLVAGDRASVTALGLLAFGMYALRPPGGEPSDAVTTALGVLGVGAIFLVAAGVLIGTHVVLVLLLSILGLVWLVLTLRHLRRNEAAAPEDLPRDHAGADRCGP